MNQSGGQQLSYAELDRLTAELLPRRLAMSNGAPAPGPAPVYYMAGPSTEVFYACQMTHSPGTPGLLNTGLLAEAPYSTMTCVPGVVHAR
jgi:hypothetical protein